MSIKIEVWIGDCGITCSTYKSCKDMRKSGAISKGAILVRSFTAKNWFEAMSMHYKLMGWGPYNPPKLPNGDIDPSVLEPLNDF